MLRAKAARGVLHMALADFEQVRAQTLLHVVQILRGVCNCLQIGGSQNWKSEKKISKNREMKKIKNQNQKIDK